MTSGSLFTCRAALLTVLVERLGVDSLVDRQGGEKDGGISASSLPSKHETKVWQLKTKALPALVSHQRAPC